MVKEFAILY